MRDFLLHLKTELVFYINKINVLLYLKKGACSVFRAEHARLSTSIMRGLLGCHALAMLTYACDFNYGEFAIIKIESCNECG